MDSSLVRNLDTTELVRSIHHAVVLPINSLLNLTDIVLSGVDGPINDDTRQDITDIATDVTRLQTVCMYLMDLCRLDGATTVCEPLDVLDLLLEAVAEASQQAVKAGKRLASFIPAELPLVQANANAVQDLILRLVNHVLHFADRVVIHVAVEVDTLIVCVGSGDALSESVQEELATLPASWLEDEWAVNLLICHRLITMQGGTLSASRLPEGNATLWFSLPLDREKGLKQKIHPES